MNSSIIVLVKIFFCFFFLLNAVHYVKANQQECINNLSYTFKGLQNIKEYVEFLIAGTINEIDHIVDCTRRNLVLKNKLPYVLDYIKHITENLINSKIIKKPSVTCRWFVNYKLQNKLSTWLQIVNYYSHADFEEVKVTIDPETINNILYTMAGSGLLTELVSDDEIINLYDAAMKNDSEYVLNTLLKAYTEEDTEEDVMISEQDTEEDVMISEQDTEEDTEEVRKRKIKICVNEIKGSFEIGPHSRNSAIISKLTQINYINDVYKLNSYSGLYIAYYAKHLVQNNLILDRKNIQTWCFEFTGESNTGILRLNDGPDPMTYTLGNNN